MVDFVGNDCEVENAERTVIEGSEFAECAIDSVGAYEIQMLRALDTYGMEFDRFWEERKISNEEIEPEPPVNSIVCWIFSK